MTIRFRTVLTVCLLWSVATVAYAQSIAESVSRSLGSEMKIREALEQDTRLEFIETPLEDICAFMSDMHSIPIQIDTKALDEVGLDTDAPVTRNLKGVSLRSALNLILDDLELTWVIRDEVLLITTAKAAKASVRVHNVLDMIAVGGTADRLAETLQNALAGPATDDGRPPIARIVPYQRTIIVRATEPGHREVESLLLQIRASMHGPSFGVRPALPPATVRPKPRHPSSVKRRKLQEHAAEIRKRKEREAAEREAAKKGPQDPFGGGGSANPFGVPRSDASKDADADPLAEDPFGERKTEKPGKTKRPPAAPEDPFAQ